MIGWSRKKALISKIFCHDSFIKKVVRVTVVYGLTFVRITILLYRVTSGGRTHGPGAAESEIKNLLHSGTVILSLLSLVCPALHRVLVIILVSVRYNIVRFRLVSVTRCCYSAPSRSRQ